MNRETADVREKFVEHGSRDAIQGEIHARPVPILNVNTRVRRLVFVLPNGAQQVSQLHSEFKQFVTAQQHSGTNLDGRQHSFSTQDYEVTWEFHTEFVTITWFADIADKQNWPDDIGLDVLKDAELLCAMRIDMIPDTEVPERLVPGFKSNSLCMVSLESGSAQIATDFVLDADKFLRFEFACGTLSDLRRSIIVRRLLEIETYRNVALLGLPLSRQLAPQLHEMESELTRVVDELAIANSVELVQSSLDSLHALSVRTGQLSERLGFRFAASAAYGEILWDRLENLNEEPTHQGLMLSSYLRYRVKPTLSTFAAMEKRLNVLAQKIDRAIELLNVRIGLDLQIQNKSVLNSIADTARGQFHLQRTVEGLSTVAISYYMLGIISYLSGWFLKEYDIDKTLALTIAAPLVVLGVWLMIRRIRSAFDKRP